MTEIMCKQARSNSAMAAPILPLRHKGLQSGQSHRPFQPPQKEAFLCDIPCKRVGADEHLFNFASIFLSRRSQEGREAGGGVDEVMLLDAAPPMPDCQSLPRRSWVWTPPRLRLLGA